MEASLYPLVPGAIVQYVAPFEKKVCQKYGIPSTRPVLIAAVNYAKPGNLYQGFILTSKVNEYHGYRLYVNALKPSLRNMTVVCCCTMYTFMREQLKDIIGFVSPSFLQKCTHAYAYEIGETKDVPPYYLQDPQCMQWLDAGEANLPSTPSCRNLLNGGTLAGNNMPIATAYKPFSNEVDDVPPVAPRKVETVEAAQPFPVVKVDYGAKSSCKDLPDDDPEEEAETLKNEDLEEGKGVHREVPSEIENLEEVPSQTSENPDAGETLCEENEPSHMGKVRYKFPQMNSNVRNLIEHDVCLDYNHKNDANLKKIRDKMDEDTQVDIMLRRIGPSDLRTRGYRSSYTTCTDLYCYVIHCIIEEKAAMIEDIISHVVDLRFMPSSYRIHFRTFSLSDIKQFHMGINKYLQFAEDMGIARRDTYIGTLVEEGLITVPNAATEIEKW